MSVYVYFERWAGYVSSGKRRLVCSDRRASRGRGSIKPVICSFSGGDCSDLQRQGTDLV